MEAKIDITFVMKSLGAYILLTTAVVMEEIGLPPAKGSIQNNSIRHHYSGSPMIVTMATTHLAEANSNRSIVVGIEVILKCPQQSSGTVVWNVKLNNGTRCYISYDSEENRAERNCSKNMDWLSRHDRKSDYSLHIQPLQIFNDGLYVCSVSTNNGTFIYNYALTVLVPPKVTLTYDGKGAAVCEAAAGKPAAKITWIPQGDDNSVNTILPYGRETISSTYNTTTVKEDNVTCFVSHPAWNKPHIFELQIDNSKDKGENESFTVIACGLSLSLLGILLLSFLIYLWASHRKDNKSKSPEKNSRHSIQDTEVEPYATFVQMENVIYESCEDFSVEKHFPPKLPPPV